MARYQFHLARIVDSVPLGLIVLDGAGHVTLSNPKAREMLGLLPTASNGAFDLAATAALLGEGDCRIEDGRPVFEVMNNDGRLLEITSSRMSCGAAVIIIDDVTTDRQQLRALRLAEQEYSSLFSNAVCGIYRDALDGTPIRCNPALAQLNGYATEDEFIAAVKARPGYWYADPERADYFKQLMQRDGGVKDLVSECYRHRTGERFWIMENAWYVRDRDGNPLYIEGTIQDATERMTTLSMIEKQANIDALTGAYSRFRFFNQLDHMTSASSPGCTLFSIDLDNFKQINDQMGHAAGDIALQEAASRLRSLLDEASFLARIGGDEFAILTARQLSEEQAADLAQSIVAVMADPVEVKGHSLPMSVSVGVAIYPQLAANFDELLGNADKALYAAKANGRNGFCVFGKSMRSRSQQKRVLSNELACALTNNQLELHYQPIVFSDTGMVEAYEALIRWQHPERGLLMPADFLPLAEEEGLMGDIGSWVMQRACQDALALPPHVQVAINVSADQFRSPRILDTLKEALSHAGLEPHRLSIEITETVILSHEQVAKRVLGRLSEMGISVALDDFGTAYSSLSYLQKYSFNKVKIDKSFVRGMFDIPADLAVVRAIVGIGRDLGIEIIAEGVENRMQMERLAREGCKRMQGFYFAKPKPLSEVCADLALAQMSPLLEQEEAAPAWRSRRY
jgi:diguanylate cyclase (GGDEF)-like protein/PAS domain S-box-containing protein